MVNIFQKKGKDYIFSISKDTANKSVYRVLLEEEIIARIPINIVDILIQKDILTIRFSTSIDSYEPILIDVINEHQGTKEIYQILHNNISPEVENYAMCNYLETRELLNIKFPMVHQPLGYLKAIALIKNYGNAFIISVVPKSTKEVEFVTRFTQAVNPVERLAYYSAFRKARDNEF